MKKYLVLLLALAITLSVTACSKVDVITNKDTAINKQDTQKTTAAETSPAQNSIDNKGNSAAENSRVPQANNIDVSKVKPNESGQIMIVMFHNFVEEYKKGKNEYTTTFSEFEKLLSELYDKNYRLINLNDMLNNEIDVPAGCIPMVFTFDDGTAGEFNLMDNQGNLTVNPRSAVGIMEAFNKKHPDFGLKGTFYVNLGVKSTFNGAGTMSDRLKYLTDKGFEVGNHTKTHVSLSSIKTPEKIQEEIGGNEKLVEELVPGYKFQTFSLPNGASPKDLKQYVVKGSYSGTEYENKAIVLVGSNPSFSPVSAKFDPLALPRVRSTGMTKVECDLSWWLDALSKGNSQYISDGNKDTVTVPKDKQKNVDMSKLNGKQLVTY